MKKLIVITTPGFFEGEAHILIRLFREGVRYLHLRKPGCHTEDIISLLNEIPIEFHPCIALHDCFEVSSTYRLGGIHLNRRNNRAPEDFKGRISCSCHSLQEIQEHPECDYVFLSPIFQSISKEGYGSGFSIERLQEASAQNQINEKVIALGGMDTTTIPHIRQLGFGGVAVLGALWGNSPSLEESDHIIKHYKQLQLCL